MISREAFVEGEAFEDKRDERFRCLVVQFDETGGGAEAIGVRVVEAAGHDAVAVFLRQQTVDVDSLPAGPALVLVPLAEHRHDEVGFFAV